MSLQKRINHYTQSLRQEGLLRERLIFPERESSLCFASNDYLSLRQEHQLSLAYQEGFKRYPQGSSSSMLLSGYHPIHREVERAFADWLEVDECVLMSSGYAANLALASLMGQLNFSCLIDKGSHASLYDGLRLAEVNCTRFIHNNLVDLRKKLRLSNAEIIWTEGIFSMSGQIPCLDQIANLIESCETKLILDEAHSIGVLGYAGKGSVSLHRLSQQHVPLRLISFGKAFAAQGALVAGQSDWIKALLQAGRSLIYSTAISPGLSYGLLQTLAFIKKSDDRRKKLVDLIQIFKEQTQLSSLAWTNSDSPIQQLPLGCPYRAKYFYEELKKEGIHCALIRSPTVTKPLSGLRVVLNYHHQEKDIKKLFHCLDLINHQASIEDCE